MPEFDNKGNRIGSWEEEFITLFLPEIRKYFTEFCKHAIFKLLLVFILKCEWHCFVTCIEIFEEMREVSNVGFNMCVFMCGFVLASFSFCSYINISYIVSLSIYILEYIYAF